MFMYQDCKIIIRCWQMEKRGKKGLLCESRSKDEQQDDGGGMEEEEEERMRKS